MTLLNDPENPRWGQSGIAARLRGARQREGVIEAVRSTARFICNADGVTFVLRDGDLCHYVAEDAIAPLWQGQRFPLSSCISGWSMLNAQTAVIEDIYADARIPHAAYRPTFVKSLIMTPAGADSPAAAIGAYWREKREFQPPEIAAVRTLGYLIGEALKGVA
jgi:two-component system CheB/CheR fusion protein